MIKNQEVFFYEDEPNNFNVEVLVKNDDIRLSSESIVKLFRIGRQDITKLINNIHNDSELEKNSICFILEHMGNNCKQKYKIV